MESSLLNLRCQLPRFTVRRGIQPTRDLLSAVMERFTVVVHDFISADSRISSKLKKQAEVHRAISLP